MIIGRIVLIIGFLDIGCTNCLQQVGLSWTFYMLSRMLSTNITLILTLFRIFLGLRLILLDYQYYPFQRLYIAVGKGGLGVLKPPKFCITYSETIYH